MSKRKVAPDLVRFVQDHVGDPPFDYDADAMNQLRALLRVARCARALHDIHGDYMGYDREAAEALGRALDALDKASGGGR